MLLRLIHTYVDHYNTVRLRSAIGYVAPHDMLAGRATEPHRTRLQAITSAFNARPPDLFAFTAQVEVAFESTILLFLGQSFCSTEED